MRSSRSIRIVLVAAVLLLLAAAVPMATTSGAVAADAPKVLGYTILDRNGDTRCDLATVDWATGAVTDLPAASSASACAYDLAISPTGTVYGLDFVSNAQSGAASLVTFAADGTPSRTAIRIPAGYAYLSGSPVVGLAIDAAGTLFIQLDDLDANMTTCAPAPVNTSVDAQSSAVADTYGLVTCLFTLDPASGVLTVVGPSRLSNPSTASLAIGSDAMRTLVIGPTYDSVSSNAPAVSAGTMWSTVNTATGEITPSAIGATNGPITFDALRSGTTVYTFAMKGGDTNPWTATVDPTTGVITPIARMDVTALAANSLFSLAVTTVPEPPTTTTTTVPEEVVVPKITG